MFVRKALDSKFPVLSQVLSISRSMAFFPFAGVHAGGSHVEKAGGNDVDK